MTRDIKDANPSLQAAWNEISAQWNKENPDDQVFLTCVHRTNEEQAELYAQGRTKPGKIVTHAEPGESKHNRKPSDAIDVAFKDKTGKINWSPELFKRFATKMKGKYPKVKWGGDFKSFKDLPHFEI